MSREAELAAWRAEVACHRAEEATWRAGLPGPPPGPRHPHGWLGGRGSEGHRAALHQLYQYKQQATELAKSINDLEASLRAEGAVWDEEEGEEEEEASSGWCARRQGASSGSGRGRRARTPEVEADREAALLEAQEESEGKAKSKGKGSSFELPHPNNPKRFYVVLNESIAPVAIYVELPAVNRHLVEGVEWGKLEETASSTRGATASRSAAPRTTARGCPSACSTSRTRSSTRPS